VEQLPARQDTQAWLGGPCEQKVSQAWLQLIENDVAPHPQLKRAP
jgi:hypothetical protein